MTLKAFSLLLALLMTPPLWAADAPALRAGIIVALETTENNLVKELLVGEIQSIADRKFTTSKLHGREVVLVRSPMGKVNNAMTASLLRSRYGVSHIISVSPAGGVSDHLQLGDLVVSNALYQHDFGTVKPYGFVSQEAPKGIHWEPKDFRVVNRQLIDLAMSYNHEGPSSVHQGVIVSGDQFVSSDEKKRWLRKKFEADAVDMGAATIGQVCQANEIPFVALRVITDRADILARTNFGSWIHPYKSSIDLLNLVSHITSGYQKELGT